MKTNEKIRSLAFTGLFASLICLTTAYIMHIPIGNGYIHLGDSLIYVAACMLPLPYGIAAAGIGGAMADLLSGYPMYVIPTLIIKSLNALCIYAIGGNGKKLATKRRITASFASCLVTVIGYYITAVILYGNPKAQLIGTLPSNAVQGIAASLAFIIMANAIDKVKITSFFKR